MEEEGCALRGRVDDVAGFEVEVLAFVFYGADFGGVDVFVLFFVFSDGVVGPGTFP